MGKILWNLQDQIQNTESSRYLKSELEFHVCAETGDLAVGFHLLRFGQTVEVSHCQQSGLLRTHRSSWSLKSGMKIWVLTMIFSAELPFTAKGTVFWLLSRGKKKALFFQGSDVSFLAHSTLSGLFLTRTLRET